MADRENSAISTQKNQLLSSLTTSAVAWSLTQKLFAQSTLPGTE